MRVLLAEDHPLMQEMIATLLSRDFDVVDVVGRGDQVVDAVLRRRPDAVVLDVSLPGRSGLQVLPELRQQNPTVAAVVLTTHESPVYRKEAFRRGADAYILKGSALKELSPAIRSAVLSRSSMVNTTRRMA